MKKIAAVLGIVLLLGLAYLLAWPVPIEPQAWTPPPAPTLEGVYARNDVLKTAQRLAPGLGHGPEGVALDAAGHLYSGFVDGRVMQFGLDGSQPAQLAHTGGRPLGLVMLPDGDLIVADAAKGLLRIAPDRSVQALATEAEGGPFRFADDVDASSDHQTLYFTDASSRFGHTQVMADFMEHGPNGRFLAYHRPSGQTRVLLEGLNFPNGVAVGPNDEFVLVNETANYRVLRYWLKGDKAGQQEVFADNLPGFPDNISFNGRDRFWCALYAPRSPDLDALLPRPFLRKIVFRLPDVVQPKPVKHAFVLGFDLQGQVVANLQHAGPDAYAPITSAKEHDGWLYLGSLTEPSLARWKLPDALK